MMPKLVVLSGYPGCGKSTIAGYMRDQLGFKIVSSDEFREHLFGVEHPELEKDPMYNFKEWGILWPTLKIHRDYWLSKGRDVVIDSTASWNGLRQMLFDTEYGDIPVPAENYLLVINVDKDVLRKRDHPDAIEKWDKYWQEPEKDSNYHVLRYQNNTPRDREAIYADLRRRFVQE